MVGARHTAVGHRTVGGRHSHRHTAVVPHRRGVAHLGLPMAAAEVGLHRACHRVEGCRKGARLDCRAGRSARRERMLELGSCLMSLSAQRQTKQSYFNIFRQNTIFTHDKCLEECTLKDVSGSLNDGHQHPLVWEYPTFFFSLSRSSMALLMRSCFSSQSSGSPPCSLIYSCHQNHKAHNLARSLGLGTILAARGQLLVIPCVSVKHKTERHQNECQSMR